MARRKATEAANENIGQGQAQDLGEIGNNPPIEPVSENDFANTAELEMFMNQLLTVMVHPDQMEGSLDTAPLMVNGLNQHVIRGREQKIKRKYVEVMARCRTTVYDQKVQNPAEPANIQMVPRASLTYPFAVLNDPHPNGREWLQAILAEQ